MNRKAKRYFLLVDNYLEVSKLILETLITNDNSNAGLGKTPEKAEENMRSNDIKSDSTLFIPMIFNSFQSIELFIKGLLLLNNVKPEEIHEISKLLPALETIYGEQSEIYKSINKFYSNQVEIIKEFKKNNNITNMKELYESLRYPEKNDKIYEYSYLKYNGDEGIKQFKTI